VDEKASVGRDANRAVLRERGLSGGGGDGEFAGLLVQPFVGGVGAGGLEFPPAGLRGAETDLPRFAAVPEAGDFEPVALGWGEGDGERGFLRRIRVGGRAVEGGFEALVFGDGLIRRETGAGTDEEQKERPPREWRKAIGEGAFQGEVKALHKVLHG